MFAKGRSQRITEYQHPAIAFDSSTIMQSLSVRKSLTNKEHNSSIPNKRVQKLQEASGYLKCTLDFKPGCRLALGFKSGPYSANPREMQFIVTPRRNTLCDLVVTLETGVSCAAENGLFIKLTLNMLDGSKSDAENRTHLLRASEEQPIKSVSTKTVIPLAGDDVNNFHDYHHIKFSMEIESISSKRPFLDCMTHKSSGKLKTTIYQKPTDTDRLELLISTPKVRLPQYSFIKIENITFSYSWSGSSIGYRSFWNTYVDSHHTFDRCPFYLRFSGVYNTTGLTIERTANPNVKQTHQNKSSVLYHLIIISILDSPLVILPLTDGPVGIKLIHKVNPTKLLAPTSTTSLVYHIEIQPKTSIKMLRNVCTEMHVKPTEHAVPFVNPEEYDRRTSRKRDHDVLKLLQAQNSRTCRRVPNIPASGSLFRFTQNPCRQPIMRFLSRSYGTALEKRKVPVQRLLLRSICIRLVGAGVATLGFQAVQKRERRLERTSEGSSMQTRNRNGLKKECGQTSMVTGWVKLSINTSTFVTQERFGRNPCCSVDEAYILRLPEKHKRPLQLPLDSSRPKDIRPVGYGEPGVNHKTGYGNRGTVTATPYLGPWTVLYKNILIFRYQKKNLDDMEHVDIVPILQKEEKTQVFLNNLTEVIQSFGMHPQNVANIVDIAHSYEYEKQSLVIGISYCA
ncbi:hypothetical protein CLF_103122 [Clonorchis sinensis]|uniref:Uncharacterized protein n=1 Tax=Clonorchis sinensis TaxID=79923 RepID=G7Y948_CLOSI|nr:hypothetical protein CLF_103122 [Clonorchis sinensis]